MELHELHVGQHRACFVSDGHAVSRGHFGICRFPIDLSQPARGQQHRLGPQLMLRTVRFIDKAKPGDATAFHNQFRCEGVRAQVQVRYRVRPGEQRPADLPAGRVAVGMQDSRAAVRRLARKSQFRSRPVEFRPPLDELRDVLRTFFDHQSHGLGAAQTITGIDGVLFV